MIVKCPECELQVSDKASYCPHCGYPMQPNIKPRKPRSKNNKRRRLPNGFGQISEIKNRNLRNPFRAMVTVGKTPTGQPICKPLKPESYFPTYNDAYAALVEYNKNPYDLEPSITAQELYDKWTAEYFKTIGESAARGTEDAWRYCSAVYTMRVIDIRARHIKGCMEEGITKVKGKEKTPSASMKTRSKPCLIRCLIMLLNMNWLTETIPGLSIFQKIPSKRFGQSRKNTFLLRIQRWSFFGNM